MGNIEEKNTTIAIKKQTRKMLATIAKKDQTFDDILKILISSWNESR